MVRIVAVYVVKRGIEQRADRPAVVPHLSERILHHEAVDMDSHPIRFVACDSRQRLSRRESHAVAVVSIPAVD